MTSTATCVLCDLVRDPIDASTDSVSLVAETAHWLLTVLPAFDMPGWYVFQSRRHVIELAELGSEELSSFGPLLAEAVTAIQGAAACDKVYIQRFGEIHPHWHALLSARPESLPPTLRGPRYFLEREQVRNGQAAAALAREVAQRLTAWRLGKTHPGAANPTPSKGA